MSEGSSDVRLYCIAQGWPEVTYEWYSLHNDIPKLINNGHKHRVYKELGVITLQNVVTSDSSKFICHMNSSAGSERAEIELLVKSTLYARIEPQFQVLRIGQTITFNCTTLGFPVVGITWLKNAKVITHSSRISFESNGHIIHIKNAKRQDTAIYQCLVRGVNGDNVQASALLSHGGMGTLKTLLQYLNLLNFSINNFNLRL